MTYIIIVKIVLQEKYLYVTLRRKETLRVSETMECQLRKS